MTTRENSAVSLVQLTSEQQKHLEAIEWSIAPENAVQLEYLEAIAHVRKMIREKRVTIPSRLYAPVAMLLMNEKMEFSVTLASVWLSPGAVVVGLKEKSDDSGDLKYRRAQFKEKYLLRPFEIISLEEFRKLRRSLSDLKLQAPPVQPSSLKPLFLPEEWEEERQRMEQQTALILRRKEKKSVAEASKDDRADGEGRHE